MATDRSGGNHTNPLSTAELYDPSSGTWLSAPSMSSPREFHTSALTKDCGVLVAGGRAGVNCHSRVPRSFTTQSFVRPRRCASSVFENIAVKDQP